MQGDRGGHHSFGAFGKAVAAGTRLRHDHGSRFVADDFQAELDLLGLASSPAFVPEPEDQDCVERFIRVLKENLLWLRRFETVEDLNRALHTFEDAYNRGWAPQRHGCRAPARVRADHLAVARAA
jgi:transposase InsO family protein